MLIGGEKATACESCGSKQLDLGMLLCDGCERGWHMRCLRPPLAEVPTGAWLCPGCRAAGGARGSAWRPAISVGGVLLRWVGRFKYLGSMLDEWGSVGLDLARRVQLAAGAFRRLEKPFFRQKCIRLGVRMLVYKVMVASVLLYGCEAWPLARAQRDYLGVFHRQRLRMILGVRLADRVSNERLFELCRSEDVCVAIDRRQLRWLGHLGRMGVGRIAKQMLYCTLAAPGRRRARGRPPPNLCTAYQALVREHLGRDRLRAAGLPPGSSWLSLCQNRRVYEGLMP